MLKNFFWIYPIKVWLISIILGPMAVVIAFILLSDYDSRSEEAGPIQFYIYIFLVGLVYSIPTILISTLAYKYLLSIHLNPILVKAILIILGFILFVLTFAFMGYPLHKLGEVENWTVPGSYSFVFLVASLMCKIVTGVKPSDR